MTRRTGAGCLRAILTATALLAGANGPTALKAQQTEPTLSPLHIEARSAQTLQAPGRQSLGYDAEVGLAPVRSRPGHFDATAGYISYTRPGGTDRPVLFVFNGGPGAASAYLHMGALGPMRAEVPQDPAAALPSDAPVVENRETLLDIADLVFLDPPGTGFSTIAADADRGFYQSVNGDADAVAQLARAWLAAHGRTAAPIFILGESYGTIRAATMAGTLHAQDPGLRLRGVLLLGQALNMIETSQRPGNVVTYPLALPTLAAIACYQHKRPQPCDPAGSAREAAAFGPAYLDALYRGRALDPAERDRIATRLSELTGIAKGYYLAHDLRISKERFRVELLRGEGRVLGRYDARYTAPRPANAGEVVGGDPFSAVSDLYGKAVFGQLKQLGVADPSHYKVIVPVDGAWTYGEGDSPFNDWPFMAQLEKVMTAEPRLRLFVGSGLYDLTTTVGATDYLFAQSSLPPDRFRSEHYPAGHVAYSDDASWHKLMADLRGFILAGAEH
ncbi:S10 family serine carboxypeptidase-like protein [Sphingomonas abietis]|uniref:Septum formation initiator n=1 Tax=Sphingomonas abietis TaxID=3012344 RepID=A0ABY7NHG2_9SPHN|nr:septum formation initiator [Sphingomonas abietis]WBO20763.1 septum formation initiator [Sphingomonas abietis]